jgi:predicted metal-binding membrane protein
MSIADPAGRFRSERSIALASLIAMAALAWLYTWTQARHMPPMPGGADAMMPMPTGMAGASAVWAPASLAQTFLMWAVMMVGMMLPSAMPAILHYGLLVKKNREAGSALPAVWVFTAGYLVVWVAFGLAATILQAAFETGRLLTPMMAFTSAWLSGGLLIAAGVYQWLPVKHACLEKCRAPLQFFLFHWRPGAIGALRMGGEHGLFCLGCCWVLMLLLFAAGVMNFVAVAVLAGFVLAEKIAPAVWRVSRISGVLLIACGGCVGLGLWP